MNDNPTLHAENMNPYYDTVLSICNITVPSKQINYKLNDSGEPILKKFTKSVREFEKNMHDYLDFTSKHWHWPLKGRLFLAAELRLSQKGYKEKDVDNIIKPLIDSMKTIVFENDVQIETIFAFKHVHSQPGYLLGLKCITDNNEKEIPWPPMPIILNQ